MKVADGNVGALQVGICVAATVKLFVLKGYRAIVKTGHIYIALMEDIMHSLQCQAGQGREKRFDE